MLNRTNLIWCLLFFFIGACASSSEVTSDEPVSPVVGIWDYSVDAPNGVLRGLIFVEEGESGLEIRLQGEADPAFIQADSIEFEQETQSLSFVFEDEEFGVINVSAILDGSELSGFMHVVQFAIDVPMNATLQTVQ